MEYLAQRGFKKDFIAEGEKYPSGTVSLILDFYRDGMVLIQKKKERRRKRLKKGKMKRKKGERRRKKGEKRKKKERRKIEKKNPRMAEVVRDLLESPCSSRITPSTRKEQENSKRKKAPRYNKDALGRGRNSMSPAEETESWSINNIGMLGQSSAGLPGGAQHPKDGKWKRRI